MICNNKRLSGTKKKFAPTITKKETKASRRSKKVIQNYGFVKTLVPNTNNKNNKIKADEEFYKKCFDTSDHLCEECGCQLPTNFTDEEGKVIAKWRYSHIIPKSIAPEIRHTIKNINHLCIMHHQEWENGDKENMYIYSKNKARLPNYF
tara:strand:- start:1288 stop:1734 length:447 start_codon:yes stop_codon:yes gene_type:complete